MSHMPVVAPIVLPVGIHSVTEFGALGDGTTDDTAAIQAALDKLEEAGGGTLYFPTGTYPSGEVTVTGDNIRVTGDGPSSVLRMKAGGGDVLLRLLGDYPTVEHLRLEAGGQSCYLIRVNVDGAAPTAVHRPIIRDNVFDCDARTAKGVFVGYYENAIVAGNELENLLALADVTDENTFGIVLHAGDNQVSKNAIVWANHVTGFYDGIESFGTGLRQATLIQGNNVRDATNVGIYNYRGAQARIVDNHVESCAAGIFADSSVPADLSATLLGNKVSDNVVRLCTTYGILLEEHQGASVTGNTCTECQDGLVVGGGCADSTISNNNCSKNTRYGIWTDKSLNPVQTHQYDLNFVGNTCKLNGEDGMRLGGVKRSCNVVGNSCCDNGTTAAALGTSTFAGLRLGSNSTADTGQVYNVEGNTLGNNIGALAGTGDVGKQGYGLLLDSATVLRAVVSGNVFGGNGQFNIRSSFNFLTIGPNFYIDGTSSLPSAVYTAKGNTGGGFATEADVVTPSLSVKTGNYTVLDTDSVLVLRAAAAASTFTLPAAPADGRRIRFANHDSADNLVIARNGQNINDAAADLTLTPGQRATLYYVSATTSWYNVG
jgi:parallel beta-helix repeat protein